MRRAGWSVVYYPFTEVFTLAGKVQKSRGHFRGLAGKSLDCGSKASCCTFDSSMEQVGCLLQRFLQFWET